MIVIGVVTDARSTGQLTLRRAVAPAVFRVMEVDLDVENVLRHEEPIPRRVSFTYLFPTGAYDGPEPNPPVRGVRGVFFLHRERGYARPLRDVPCSFIRIYAGPHPGIGKAPATPEQMIAEAALAPKPGYSPEYLNHLARSVVSVGIPMIGSRATLALLAPLIKPNKSELSAGVCLAVSEVWKFHDGCVNQLMSETREGAERERYSRLLDDHRAWLEREERRLSTDPSGWLDEKLRNWGMDGALLWLSGLMRRNEALVNPTTCQMFSAKFRAGDYDLSLATGSLRSGEAAERLAILDFDRWLTSGCPPRL